MLLIPLALATLCLSCDEPAQPTGPRLGVPAPNIELGAEGCARFQVRFQQGNTAVIEETYNSSGCPAQELKLFSDTTATFDAATGALRIAIRVKNEGTTTVIPRLRLRFHADSAQRFNANGQPLGGVSDILGYQPDSTSLAGRIAFWFYNTYMAPAGQPQVLPPGATTERRWIEFRGTTWSPHVRLKLVVAGQEVGAVPAVPPDTMPANFYADSNIVSAPALTPGRFVRDVIWVVFKANASSSARTAAIASVGGIVVGGYRIGSSGGSYVVRLPRDSSHRAIFAADVLLRNNPAVALVDIVRVFDGVGAFLRANDGNGWAKADFKLSPDSGFAPAPNRETSALAAISAPLAWGCSVGDTTATVAVIDVGLHTTGLSDLNRNLYRGSGLNRANNPDRHGTAVSMLLAARGNDSTSMTGVAWRAKLSLRDVTMLAGGVPQLLPNGKSKSSNLDAKAHIDSAVFYDSARIVNLSLGTDTAVTGVLADSALRNRGAKWAAAVKHSVSYAPADTPLFVVAAGNNAGADPAYSYYPYIKDSLPNHTLVVTAAGRTPGVAFYNPPTASRIVPDIAAPGEQVYSMDGPNSVVLASGTSFSAPLVSGSALLLFAFDPRLTAREVRQLLVQGAVRGSRVAGQYPILNAYESLKLAAERPGAPLCGNVVVASPASATGGTTTVRVTRGSGPMETIATIPTHPDTVIHIDVVHGGKQLIRETGDFPRRWETVAQHNGTSWQVLPAPWTTIPNPSITGSSNSWHGWSHDADTLLSFGSTENFTTGAVTVSLNLMLRTGTHLPVFKTFSGLAGGYNDPLTGVTHPGGAAGAFGALSPSGDFAIIQTYVGSAFGTLTFHKVSTATGATTTLFSDPTFAPTLNTCRGICPSTGPLQSAFSPGISEDGTEFWYFVPTASWGDYSAGCALKRYSLKLQAMISVTSFSGSTCFTVPVGSARAASWVPIGTR